MTDETQNQPTNEQDQPAKPGNQDKQAKKVKFLNRLETIGITIAVAGGIGATVSLIGGLKKHKTLAAISSLATSVGVLGAVYASSRKATMTFDAFMNAFTEYQKYVNGYIEKDKPLPYSHQDYKNNKN